MLTASHLLSLELCRMLKFVCFLSIPQSWPTFCTCSLAVRKGSLSQPSEVCTGNQPWSESENEVPKGLEVTVGQLQGESIAGHSQWLMHSLSDVCGSGVSRIQVLLMLSESPGCYSSLLSHPPPPPVPTVVQNSSVFLSDFILFCFIFCSNNVLEFLCWTPEFPERDSHLWVIFKSMFFRKKMLEKLLAILITSLFQSFSSYKNYAGKINLFPTFSSSHKEVTAITGFLCVLPKIVYTFASRPSILPAYPP